jgi:hypothetical protein
MAAAEVEGSADFATLASCVSSSSSLLPGCWVGIVDIFFFNSWLAELVVIPTAPTSIKSQATYKPEVTIDNAWP